MQIFKIAYCDWCGNENLQPVDNKSVYCFNCGENTDMEKLKYRNARDSEEVVYKTKKVKEC